MTVAEKIRKQMSKEPFTQVEWAEVFGKPMATVKGWITGKGKAIPIDDYYLMSKIFDVPMEYWVSDEMDDEINAAFMTLKAIRNKVYKGG